MNRTSEHASIQQQRADCTALADRLGYTRTIEFVDEAVSAYQDRTRLGYQQLLQQIERAETPTLGGWDQPPLPEQRRIIQRQVTDIFIDRSRASGKFDPYRLRIEWRSNDLDTHYWALRALLNCP